MLRVQEHALFVVQFGLKGSFALQHFMKIDRYVRCLLMNKTNHPIYSNNHPSATANKAIQNLKRRLQNQREHHIILTKYEHS